MAESMQEWELQTAYTQVPSQLQSRHKAKPSPVVTLLLTSIAGRLSDLLCSLRVLGREMRTLFSLEFGCESEKLREGSEFSLYKTEFAAVVNNTTWSCLG